MLKNLALICGILLTVNQGFATEWLKSDFTINGSIFDIISGKTEQAFQISGSSRITADLFYCKLVINNNAYSCKLGEGLDPASGVRSYYAYLTSNDFIELLRKEAALQSGSDKTLQVLDNYYATHSDKRMMILIGNNSPTALHMTNEQDFLDPKEQLLQVNIEVTSNEVKPLVGN